MCAIREKICTLTKGVARKFLWKVECCRCSEHNVHHNRQTVVENGEYKQRQLETSALGDQNTDHEKGGRGDTTGRRNKKRRSSDCSSFTSIRNTNLTSLLIITRVKNICGQKIRRISTSQTLPIHCILSRKSHHYNFKRKREQVVRLFEKTNISLNH